MAEINTLPIGVFDSGLGGLTIAKAMRNLMPHESLYYFGDTAHLPYGDKSPEAIRQYVKEITRFLIQQPVKAIVIACNTASAVALDEVKSIAGSLPVFDVVYPAALYSLSETKNRKIGVIGTRATITSGIYGRLLNSLSHSSVSVIEKATPLLVPMIEEGWLQNKISLDVIHEYLSDKDFQEIDTLILGCTHYPLIKNQIQDFFENHHKNTVKVVDSSTAVAEYVRKQLSLSDLLTIDTHEKSRFFLSDFSQNFQDSAKLFMGQSIDFEKVTLS
ncbi:MAG: glutamate racemase [Bacteroidia bacterium]|nr:glutamate racemase [Bacteroidia bacterium]